MPSESIAALPVMEAAKNFVMEIRAFPISAAIITFLELEAMGIFII